MFKFFRKSKKQVFNNSQSQQSARRSRDWQPKIYILQKDIPGLRAGARFRQTYQSDNVYFYGIPVDTSNPGNDQVGIIKFEARVVENNPEWFKRES